MFIVVTLEWAVLMGKNYSDKWHSFKKTKDCSMKQMFDMSAKLVSDQDEIYGVKAINWLGKIILGSICLELAMKKSAVVSAQKITFFQILCIVALVRYTRTPKRDKDWSGSKHLRSTENWDRIDGEPILFEWIICQGFDTLQLNEEVKSLLLRLGETP